VSAFDFPDNPATGDIFMNRWMWNGTVWVSLTTGGGGGGGIPEAPQTGDTFGRRNAQWVALIDDKTY
jgi:hypothetical protein